MYRKFVVGRFYAYFKNVVWLSHRILLVYTPLLCKKKIGEYIFYVCYFNPFMSMLFELYTSNK